MRDSGCDHRSLGPFALLIEREVILELRSELVHKLILDLFGVWHLLLANLGLSSTLLNSWHGDRLHNQPFLRLLVGKLLLQFLAFLDCLFEKVFVTLDL